MEISLRFNHMYSTSNISSPWCYYIYIVALYSNGILLQKSYDALHLLRPETHQMREISWLKHLNVICCHLAALQCQWLQILQSFQMGTTRVLMRDSGLDGVSRGGRLERALYVGLANKPWITVQTTHSGTRADGWLLFSGVSYVFRRNVLKVEFLAKTPIVFCLKIYPSLLVSQATKKVILAIFSNFREKTFLSQLGKVLEETSPSTGARSSLFDAIVESASHATQRLPLSVAILAKCINRTLSSTLSLSIVLSKLWSQRPRNIPRLKFYETKSFGKEFHARYLP